ncbi:MAG TPA: YraN family protein [Candidatus Limnocylindrales bacterium]|nr:YraN family protein [Candidatus Limnocylindrales bacterium]
MPTAAQVIGASAEAAVARRLRAEGWRILGRNLRVGRAEVDILAVDPGWAGSGPALVAVEVRWRRRRDFGLPEETVDRAKVARLRSAALALRELPPSGRAPDGAVNREGLAVPRLPVRVDLVAVEPGGVIRHHRAIG